MPPDENNEENKREEQPGRRPTGTGHTVVRHGCSIDASFGLYLKKQNGNEVDRFLFSATQPELKITSNGSVGVHILVRSVGDYPGRLSIQLHRTSAGDITPSEITIVADNYQALLRALQDPHKSPEASVPPPPGINVHNRDIVETITAMVVWDPDQGEPCSVTETLRLHWLFVLPHGQFKHWKPTDSHASETNGQTGATVAHGETVVVESHPDGASEYMVALQTFFRVRDADTCCNQSVGYAVIQFVRHRYNLHEQPRKQDEDSWTLDVLSSEIQKAKAGQPYDPTFTHDPLGSNPVAPPLVYPGPDPRGASSIAQFDRPGIPEELYNRFMRSGGTFTWDFLSLLVCEHNPGDAAAYLADSLVAQALQYELTLTFTPGFSPPRVSGRIITMRSFTPCRRLADLLTELDRSATQKSGTLLGGFQHPRDHGVGIPR